MRTNCEISSDSRIYCAEIKTWRIESRNLPAICYSHSYILRNSKSYCISCPVLFILTESVKLNTGFACYYRQKGRRERRPNARQPPDFLGIFLSPPLLSLSSSAAPFLCPRYRPSYPARGCANYIGGRESVSRSTIEIACRLSAWPPQPFPPSPPPPFLAISSFRALFHRQRQTIQAPTSTASRQQSCRQSYCPPGEPATAPSLCPRSRAMTIVRPRNDGEDNEDDEEMPVSSWKIS